MEAVVEAVVLTCGSAASDAAAADAPPPPPPPPPLPSRRSETSFAMNDRSSCTTSTHGCRELVSSTTPPPIGSIFGRTYGVGALACAQSNQPPSQHMPVDRTN